MSKYDDLVKKLKEIFQIDKPELDFGVYRILNARSAEITDYLENRLKTKVQESIALAGSANTEHLQKELAEKETQYRTDGIDPETVPKVRELRQKLAEYSAGSSEYEDVVFTHLLTFFSRYYDSGDFISQRRYKGDTYAIPYAGEEVMLHWANKDQYYTKSGENFSNYAFKLEDSRTVSFKLVAADTAKDNRKENDKERRFVLVEEQVRTLIDDEGEEYEETLMPLVELDDELVIHFEYKAMPKGSKQEAEITKAVKTVLEAEIVTANWLELAKREPTESNPQRTLLEKCLVNYTSKNTADYFIHKDLGGFLRGELDFYIKNEVMNLDDVQHAEKFSDIEKNLRLIQTLRSIALDLISFLAQLEDFQKNLWLKKKFVVATNYCITLDRIPQTLYAKIAANEDQWKQWKTLGMLDDDKPDLSNQPKAESVEFLKAHQFLMADTTLFDNEFKYALLATLDNLDQNLNGLLIHGDNSQALNLIEETYREKINCIYIDPPYNTAASEIAYKNSYKHSSWMSLILSRLENQLSLLAQDGFSVLTIDYAEFFNVGKILDQLFGEENRVGIVTIFINPKGRQHEKFFSSSTEYMLVYSKNVNHGKFNKTTISEEKTKQFEFSDEKGKYRLDDFVRIRSGTTRRAKPKFWYPIYVSPDLKTLTLKREPGYFEVFPINNSGDEYTWKVIPESFEQNNLENLYIAEYENDSLKIFNKYYEQQVLPNLWTDKKYFPEFNGTNLLKGILGENDFDYPKSLYAVHDTLKIMSKFDGLILDYFGGSGTTGHAVINLNREDGGKRKYILVEQGDYFDTVLKPRIQKVIYSADWRDGKAVSPQTGISHAFKVLKIESYEDTLNNLQLNRSEAQQDLLSQLPETVQDNYLMRYMLDIESKDSLLSVKHFNKPFDYKLKVAVNSAGAYEEKPVDLLETFNYLIGLSVEQINYQLPQGFVTVIGKLPTREKTLVLWRDIEDVDYLALNKLCDRLAINPSDNEFDIVYINGDHNIPSAFTSTEAEGGITKRLALRQIEPEFLSRMFSMDNL